MIGHHEGGVGKGRQLVVLVAGHGSAYAGRPIVGGVGNGRRRGRRLDGAISDGAAADASGRIGVELRSSRDDGVFGFADATYLS